MSNIYGECVHGNNLAICDKCNINNYYNDVMVRQDYSNMKVPIKKGCTKEVCFCNGSCNEIIGFRDKIQGEL